MDAFRRARWSSRWSYCPCSECRPIGHGRRIVRRNARARMRVATRVELQAAELDALPEPELMPWEVVPAWAFECPCGDRACDGVA